MAIRIGVDTGGTFTDVVACNAATGRWVRLKVPSTRDDPSQAIAAGVAQAVEAMGGGAVERVVHGTTVATNALLERRGARTALVTTTGMRDVLAIGRQNRPALYDLRAANAFAHSAAVVFRSRGASELRWVDSHAARHPGRGAGD